MSENVKIVLDFPPAIAEVPLVYRLVRDHDLIINIIRAEVRENSAGKMVLELTGSAEAIEAGIAYLKDSGINVRRAELHIEFKQDSCVSCGACVVHCRGEALTLDEDRVLQFDPAKCVLCGRCTRICPLRLFKLTF